MGVIDLFFKKPDTKKLNNNKEYDTEFSDADAYTYAVEQPSESYAPPLNPNNIPPYNTYSANGINIEVTPTRITLFYNGILAKDGAKEVIAVVGHGDNSRWEDVKEYPMWYAGNQTFVLYIPPDKGKSINIAFKDSAGNWDNNSGRNYTFNNLIG